ncbi:double-stranded DNA-binding domain-containing protein, putative [Eimeria brunetti]|uniref:Double-stranded DNA-binding domain-containing protein, putative n=1 Tax=Eimeria brunetti TaxID=51314 RepID=U6LKC8_9EIME|nr:double-stranded DNA-binding domain-containing protein, putative [Eimeria brunetti]
MDPTDPNVQKQLQQQMQHQQQQEEKRKAIEEQRRLAMKSLLSPDAQERLARIHMVKPQNALAAENYIMQAVRTGSIAPPVGDSALVEILKQIAEGGAGQTNSAPKVVQIRRRRFDDDSDDDI